MTASESFVQICTQYAQKGMPEHLHRRLLYGHWHFFLHPYFFIGYLIGIAFFGLYQAIFMANAGGAWDNAKKNRRSRPQGKGHAASRSNRCRRYRRRPFQRHVFGFYEPHH